MPPPPSGRGASPGDKLLIRLRLSLKPERLRILLRQRVASGFARVELDDWRQLGRRKVLAVSGLAAIGVYTQRTAVSSTLTSFAEASESAGYVTTSSILNT